MSLREQNLTFHCPVLQDSNLMDVLSCDRNLIYRARACLKKKKKKKRCVAHTVIVFSCELLLGNDKKE